MTGRIFRKPSLLIIAVILTSCASSSDTGKKSALNYLSGEHYEKARIGSYLFGDINIPVKTKKVSTRINGTFFVSEFVPLKYTTIFIKTDGKTVLSTSTNHNGSFEFIGYVPNGEYLVETDSEKYKFEQRVIVDKYEIVGLIFTTKENGQAM